MIHPFKRGERYRVIKPGARLTGMQPIRGGFQGWGQELPVGTILTCDGESWTFGDGVPVIKWTDENGRYIANDCEFRPSVGGMWNLKPDASYLELVS